MIRGVAWVLFSLILLSSCGPPWRTITLTGQDSEQVSGKLIAYHNGCILIDTTENISDDLTLPARWHDEKSMNQGVWQELWKSCAAIREGDVSSATLEGENHVGTGLLTGLAITGIVSAAAALAAKGGSRTFPPEVAAAAYGLLVGVPAVLIGFITGAASSHAEQQLLPSDPEWGSTLKEESYFHHEIPIDLDSLSCF